MPGPCKGVSTQCNNQQVLAKPRHQPSERDLQARESEPTTIDNDSLYPYVNNDIDYKLFEDIVDSYYLDSQIKDDFQCNHDCYSQHRDLTIGDHSNTRTHDYQHITQSVQD